MATEITIPRLGWSMEEGTFSEWLKAPGEAVQSGEPLFSVESDKVTMDVESLDSGILYIPPDAPQQGAIVKPGQLIGYLLAEAEQPPAVAAPPTANPLLDSVTEPPSGNGSSARTEGFITPRARRVAAELGVDTARLSGTGRGGRIREQDVRAVAVGLQEEAVPVSPTRRTIAAQMIESQRQTAAVTLTRRVDASRLAALRNRWKLKLLPEPAPTLTDIVLKLTAVALQKHPVLGGRWDDERIVIPPATHIGFAVDTDHGLLVPVIRDAPHLTLEELAGRSRALIEAARRREIKAADLQGGVFTISNLGSFGVEAFTPIINPPQTAVLGLGAIRWEPAVSHSGEIVARQQMMLSLTFDHRVVDGAPAARFLQTVAAMIEEPPAAVYCP
jgi:pyruvate dehydrogenase E2 component (dihydrolipoamide acetyltransferase)